jgi:REP element-mobilizing transposase RayT
MTTYNSRTATRSEQGPAAMPCYLFTYHSFGSWLPDRKRGYVKRHRGILAPDKIMAEKYRSAMKETVVELQSDIQRIIIDAVLDSREKQRFETYYITTDATHVHVLVGWRDERPWLHLRSIIKGSISRRLNQDHHRRTWFAEGGSRKQVTDHVHFNYLVQRYLPKHRGWKWSPQGGIFH